MLALFFFWLSGLIFFLCAHDRKKMFVFALRFNLLSNEWLSLTNHLLTSTVPVKQPTCCCIAENFSYFSQLLRFYLSFMFYSLIMMHLGVSLFLFILFVWGLHVFLLENYQPLSPLKSSLLFPLLCVLSFPPYLYLYHCSLSTVYLSFSLISSLSQSLIL